MDLVKTIRVMTSKGIQTRAFYGDVADRSIDALGTFTQVKHINVSPKTHGIVATSNTGNVAIYSINDVNHDKVIKQMGCHFGPVSQMAVSPDNMYLFTAGLDGALFVYNIIEQQMSLANKTFKKVVHADESAVANDKKS